jgi:hypothetical protein
MNVKSLGRSLLVIGLVMIMLGILFTLQSLSVVGPSSSFMFRNQDWTVNGGVIIGIGISIFVFGVALQRLSPK